MHKGGVWNAGDGCLGDVDVRGEDGMLERRDGDILCYMDSLDCRGGDGLLLFDNGVRGKYAGNLGRDGCRLMLNDQGCRRLQGRLGNLSREGNMHVDDLGDVDSCALGRWVIVVWSGSYDGAVAC